MVKEEKEARKVLKGANKGDTHNKKQILFCERKCETEDSIFAPFL